MLQTNALNDHVVEYTQTKSWLVGKTQSIEANRVADLDIIDRDRNWVIGQYTTAIAEEAVARVTVNSRVTMLNQIELLPMMHCQSVSNLLTICGWKYNGLQTQVDHKLEVSTEYQKRLDGSLMVNHLYISDVWRVVDSTSVGSKRLNFEYSPESGVTWQTAVPFIRAP